MLEEAILELADYGIRKDLIAGEDKIWAVNQLLSLFGEDTFSGEPEASGKIRPLADILSDLLSEAAARGLCGDSVTERDLFDTKIMGVFTDRPSAVIRKFHEKYAGSPQDATDWFYQYCKDINYIRTDRAAKNLAWTTATPYGTLDITINLAKPEKDPKAIAEARKTKAGVYPRCQLCRENEGYAGRMDHPARENLRMIPIVIDGQPWFFQYSPYGYYNEHCIALNRRHVPMKVERKTFEKLFDFLQTFPHYFIGSNADLPIVGGSILAHDHYQGGRYQFAIERASVRKELSFRGYEDVRAAWINWPVTTIRLTSPDREKLADLADRILRCWRTYSDPDAGVLAETDGIPHNTITPIARRAGGDFQLDLALRNNRTTGEYPLGIFHPHAEYHHIKKENIGLIEVMGLAILPARLKDELRLVADGLLTGADLTQKTETAKHAAWAADVKRRHPELCADNADSILKEETGIVFSHVLENAGVFKMNDAGGRAMLRFVAAVNYFS